MLYINYEKMSCRGFVSYAVLIYSNKIPLSKELQSFPFVIIQSVVI